MMKLTYSFFLAVFTLFSNNVFAEKLDDLLGQQSNAKAEKKQLAAKDEVIAEYRALLSYQLDSAGHLIWDRFEYQRGDDLLRFSASGALDESLAQDVYTDYKIPMGCIGGGFIFRPIITNLLTATYAKNETIKQDALAGLNRGLEERRLWIESAERNTPGLCANSDKQFRKMLNDLLSGVQDAPRDAIKIRKEMTEQRDAKVQAKVASEKLEKDEAERKKAAQADAAKGKEQQNFDQCFKQFGIPLSVAQRTVDFYSAPVGLCHFVLSARDAGIAITYAKNTIGVPYSILMKKAGDRISVDMAEPKDIGLRDVVLVPVNYSINGESQQIEQINDAARLVLNINALMQQK